MTNKEHLQNAIKRIETGAFKWTPSYNGAKNPTTGCLVDLLCGRSDGEAGFTPEVYEAGKKERSRFARAGLFIKWNDRQKSDKAILRLLKRAVKLCEDE